MNREITKRIKAIADRLKKQYRAEKVILYGSYATGQETPDSDLDLFVIAPTKEKFFLRMASVSGLIRDLRKGIVIEPLVLTPEEVEHRIKIGDQFIREIVEKGVQL